MSDIREQLAAYAHYAWAGWMQHLFARAVQLEGGALSMRPEDESRWRRQMYAPYATLSETEKESDRAEADRMLAILDARHASLERALAALRQRHEAMTQAVGLATTIKGDMEMRADDPIGMMQEVCAYVDTLRQRIEALELGINSALASETTMGGVDIAYLLDALGEQP